MKVTLSFYPLSDKERTGIASHCIWQFFDTKINAGVRDNVTTKKKESYYTLTQHQQL